MMQTKFERLIGLDLLRCILMLIGPMYHIAHLFHENNKIIPIQNNTIYDALSLTHPFRMEMFFILSGFFSSFLYEKKGYQYFKRSRIEKILIPLFFSLIIIWPLTQYIEYSITSIFKYSLNHIWFLLTLGIISIIYYTKYDLLKTIILYINRRNLYQIIIIVSILGIVSIFLNFIIESFLNKFDSKFLIFIYKNLIIYPLIYIVPTILGSCLYYKDYNINKKYYPIITVGFIIFHSIFISNYYNELNSIIKLILRSGYIINTSLLILMIFNIFRNLSLNNNGLIKFFVNSSFTIYLIHPPILYLNAILVNNYIENTFSQFIIINLLTYSQSIIFFIIISNLKIGRILFAIKKSELNVFKKFLIH
ncbi:acyltransferase family protein [Faecalibacter macacae]|uniref:Acyltransferase 3 domain-containing protein n=1 Tax=Faecalibacter macacae TaxID=1859289 RepID=A0A3L9MC09_9FLAO|nr:acyltransferase family protein [Faecalibacter macacae]RLZ10538.1 hypothetical protein EAH69_07040 [Faecalibacter macacae]